MKTVYEKTPEQKAITLKRLTLAIKEAARREQLMQRKAELTKAGFKAAKRASKLAKKAAKKAAKRVKRTQAVLDAWMQQEAKAKKRTKRASAKRPVKPVRRVLSPQSKPAVRASAVPAGANQTVTAPFVGTGSAVSAPSIG